MITREEYNKALDVVEAYHKQLFIGSVMSCNNDKTLVDDWINANRNKISGKLIKCLERREFRCEGERLFVYIEDITEHNFMKGRDNGKVSWKEFQYQLSCS